MKKTLYILLGTLLTACSNEVTITPPQHTVGAENNTIALLAGISEGNKDVTSRVLENPDVNHANHVKFSDNTQISIKVDGVWTGHYPEDVTHTTTGTVSTIVENTDDKHRWVDFTSAKRLYWDDYGTADPDNASTGRERGLDVFGVAVDGLETAPTVSSWTAMLWELPANQSAGWAGNDLLISNNVKYNATKSLDNAYKFSQKGTGKLLEFTHAMSKITVNLTAGAGFPSGQFQNNLSVSLLQFNNSGTVNVLDGSYVPTASTPTITPHLVSGGVGNATASFDALVFPGNNITNVATTHILQLNADGNIYYVNGTKLYNKMTELTHGYVIKPGVNYIINIIVKKTDIDITATIKNWDKMEASNETPLINITDAYGYEGTNFAKAFDLYRSKTVDGNYKSGLTEGNHTEVNYTASPSAYTMTPQMYWPDHNTHYFFRGIWPRVGSKDNEEHQLGPTDAQMKENSVVVSNVQYKEGYYPSDLMIGIPRKNDGSYDETCQVTGHSGSTGICATEGKVRMNFKYAMSQVVVELATSDGNDKVVFDDETKVEIVDCYANGEIKLSDESSDFTGKTRSDYSMHNKAADDYDSYHDAIIPQSLQTEGGEPTLKFRITVKSGETLDKYETVMGIKDIQVQENGGAKKYITAWEGGKKYTYSLYITKTGVKVEATINNWINVTAGENVWF